MNSSKNNTFFWQKLDTSFLSGRLVIDRPRNTCHYKCSSLVYPVNYGYPNDTTGPDQAPIDVSRGSEKSNLVQSVVVSADILKEDCEVKLLAGCTEENENDILEFLNQAELQKAVLIRRGNEVPEWAQNDQAEVTQLFFIFMDRE